MENLLTLDSMLTGIGAGTIAFSLSNKQPDKARQMRGMGVMFDGIASLMAVRHFA